MEPYPPSQCPPPTEADSRHMHSHHRHHHQQHHWCYSNTSLLYAVFLFLLLLWIGLQFLMAQVHLDGISAGRTSLPRSTDDGHKNSGVAISYQAMVDLIQTGATFYSQLLRPSSNSREKTHIAHHQSQGSQNDYLLSFCLLLSVNVLVMIPKWCQYFSIKDSLPKTRLSKATQSLTHDKLLKTYLIPYLLATSADWLQGPYKYALYSSYGYTQRDIAHLFVAGYGSG